MKGAASLLHGDGGAGLVGGDEEVGVGGEIIPLGVDEGWGACVEGGEGVVDEILDLGGTGGVAGGEVSLPDNAVRGVEATVDEMVVWGENGR